MPMQPARCGYCRALQIDMESVAVSAKSHAFVPLAKWIIFGKLPETAIGVGAAKTHFVRVSIVGRARSERRCFPNRPLLTSAAKVSRELTIWDFCDAAKVGF